MAIDRIPGVGPTNADIASTIATTPAISAQITANVPTASAIATAVAAPSLAQITSAITTNAASAGVTMAAITSSITTNAASAGVTLAAIGTQVANNAPSPNNWTFLGTGNLQNVSSATVSFSSYRTLRIGFRIIDAADSPAFRLNGDTGVNYINGYNLINSGSTNPLSSTVTTNDRIPVTYNNEGVISGVVFIGDIEISPAGLSNLKLCKIRTWYTNQSSFNRFSESYCTYNSTAAITSITFFNAGGSNFSGNSTNIIAFQVFGAN